MEEMIKSKRLGERRQWGREGQFYFIDIYIFMWKGESSSTSDTVWGIFKWLSKVETLHSACTGVRLELRELKETARLRKMRLRGYPMRLLPCHSILHSISVERQRWKSQLWHYNRQGWTGTKTWPWHFWPRRPCKWRATQIVTTVIDNICCHHTWLKWYRTRMNFIEFFPEC